MHVHCHTHVGKFCNTVSQNVRSVFFDGGGGKRGNEGTLLGDSSQSSRRHRCRGARLVALIAYATS